MPVSDAAAAADLDLIRDAAEEAGRMAMRHFRKNPDVWFKHEGRSPVSEADIAIDRMLRAELLAARPGYGWLSEESEQSPADPGNGRLFVVDPIDGTRAFVEGRNVWCVSIAVVFDGEPVAGVLAAPAAGDLHAASTATPATRNGVEISVREQRDDGRRPVMAIPGSIASALPKTFIAGIERHKHVPSLAHRIAMVADGRLDATFVRRNASDWDIAAADIILQRAGGRIVVADGTPVRYERETTTHGLLIAGGNGLLPPLVRMAQALDGH